MKYIPKIAVAFWFLLLLAAATGSSVSAAGMVSNVQPITQWDMLWNSTPQEGSLPKPPADSEDWKQVGSDEVPNNRPTSSTSAWIRMTLPELGSETPAILLENVYGRHVILYKDGIIVYESFRSYNYEQNKILLPLDREDSSKKLYIWTDSRMERIGISGEVLAGDQRELMNIMIQKDLFDVILGSAFILVALTLAMCSTFLFKPNLSVWLSLCAVILAIGLLILTYSPFLFTFYREYGELYLALFDIALFLLPPSLALFFEQMLGDIAYIRRFRKWLTFYSVVCLLLMTVNLLTLERYYRLYYGASVTMLGLQLMALLIFLMVASLKRAWKGDREAVILSVGFACFAAASISELLWFYIRQGHYNLFLWKWGVVGFVISLITILGRRLAEKHRQVVQYSQELEMFNNELQRSEKMEIISDLAASVAHEVRNPLQVTRGFLQLMSGKEEGKNRDYLQIALEELDRASNIITDFLTFAKPEFEHIKILHIDDEFRHIEGIISPMANLQGGKIYLDIPTDLAVKGNSSKFKQAFINIIKNSIEALGDEGQIHIRAYRTGNEVFIHIRDNGEGMDAQTLTRLGEPYFSNKTKGTGLGMMVTFRIIEAMDGRITFTSAKGVGTESTIRFPAAGTSPVPHS
ncbi:sensor histidine kinase [Paenibacillus sp. P96]|uniref:histidine kinase n=1 Tax=Paenibacillus zeirhizosphaerae TaxID=2987519 RepID=A0ABT9FX32_9BACL|nr:sensor histidine kinase [Paenibacillus sp. P96]MDP4099027.1 sensor histidine kinase [Paenibacillus sp. P96]